MRLRCHLSALACSIIISVAAFLPVSAAEPIYTTTTSGAVYEVSAAGLDAALAAVDPEGYFAILNAQTQSFYWDGTVLTASRGVNYGPSGKEVWYSMDMSTVVAALQERGYVGDYWVRADGCQMYGTCILVAANYNEYPYGSLIETSLGTAIVADTGGFSNMIDIATVW